MSHTHNPSLLPPDREEGTFNLMQSVKRRFYAMRNGMLAAQMRQGGVDYRINFGLTIPQIKDIAAELIASGLSAAELASLARALWDNESTRESRLLAPMILPPEEAPEVAARWMEEAQTAEIADMLCHSLLRRLDCAPGLVAAAMASPTGRLGSYTPLRLLANLLASGRISADEAEKTMAASPAEAGDAAMVKRLRTQIEQEISAQRLL